MRGYGEEEDEGEGKRGFHDGGCGVFRVGGCWDSNRRLEEVKKRESSDEDLWVVAALAGMWALSNDACPVSRPFPTPKLPSSA